MEDTVKKNRKKLEENRQILSTSDKQKLGQLKNLNKRQNPFGIPLAAKFFLPDTQKRSRLDNMRFLLGGNISDPLNLSSLNNESDVDSTLSTLESRRDRVEVIIPPNIHDPLHLLNPVDTQEYEKQLSSAGFKKKRQRKRNKSTSDYHIKTRKQSYKGSLTASTPIKNKDKDDNDSSDANLSKDENASDDQSPVKRKKLEKDKDGSLDKIVSPVVPPAGWKKPGKSMHRLISLVEDPKAIQSEKPLEPDTVLKTSGELPSTSSATSPSLIVAKPTQGFVKPEELQKEVKFQHGNYNRYFGCGSLNQNIDVRLKVLQDHSHLFANKDVLDVGCNVGLLTIALAQQFNPKSIVGVDIDRKLIDIAENKLQKFVKLPVQPGSGAVAPARRTDCFPTSFAINYGNMGALLKKVQKIGVQTPSAKGSTPRNNDPTVGFPDNITFETMDYVPKDESRLNKDAEKYDLILCLSVTKWIHLNYGDAGLRLTFKRIFRQLRPGGKLILEAQNWPNYKKKKKISTKIFENYKNIEFYPKLFSDYLLSPEVGFSHSLILGAPQHLSKGFKRPIELFVKGDFTPNQATKWSDAYNPQTPFELRSSVYSEFMYSNKYAPCMRRPSNYSLASPFTPYLTSPYYQPAPSSSYTPSYDNENTRNHVFMSPIYLSPGRSRRSVEASPNNEPNRSPASHLYHIYTSNSPNPSPKRFEDQT